MTGTRRKRGRETEHVAAAAFTRIWPDARAIAASLPGADIENTPGVSIEVKARRGLDLTGWLRQTTKRPGLPILVIRGDGQGPATVDQWAAVLPLHLLIDLLAEAGYGTPQEGKP